MNLMEAIIAGKLAGGGGGGGTVDMRAIVDATASATDEQKEILLSNIGAEPEKLVVTITYDMEHDVYSADKTFAQILAAYEAGKTIEAVDPGADKALQLSVTDGELYFIFSDAMCGDDGYLYGISFVVDANDGWEFRHVAAAREPSVSSLIGATQTITPADNTVYKCRELTSLTITDPPATGHYVIIFTSGATATTTTIPSTINGLESFAAEANTRYEIDVEDNYAVVGHWAVSA